MAPGASIKFGASIVETEVFGSICTTLKRVHVTLLRLFGVPAAIGRPYTDLAPP